MSGGTIGAVAGGIAGAIIGSFIPGVGWALGWTIGSTVGGIAGSIMDPTVQEAPRLNDTKLQRSQYGAPIAMIWGSFRLAGHVFWIGNNGELVESSSGGGGKGGGGGSKGRTYTGSWGVLFNESTLAGEPALEAIDRWWADGRRINYSDINATIYTGWPLQLPDSSIEADLGVGNAPAMRYQGSVVMNQVQMEQFFNRLPNLEVLARTVGHANGPILQVASNTNTSWAEKTRPLTWTTQWETDGLLPNPSSTEDAGSAIYLDDTVGSHRLFHIGQHYIPSGSGLSLVDVFFDYAQVRIGIGQAPSENAPTTLGLPAVSAITGFSAGLPIIVSDIPFDAGVEVGRHVTGVAFTPDHHTMIILTAPLNPDTNPDTRADMWHRIVDGVMTEEGERDYDQWDPLLVFGFGNVSRVALSSVSNSIEPNGKYIWRYHDTAAFGSTISGRDPLSVSLLYIDDANVMKMYKIAELPNNDYYLSFGGPSQANHQGGCLVTEEGYFGVITGTQTALYTRLAGPATVTLAKVMSDILQKRDGLAPSRFDVSAGEAVIIKGFGLTTQSQKRNAVAILQQAYNFDMCESDDGTSGILKLVFRGGAPVVEIPVEDLGVRAEGEGPKPLLELIAHLQEHELPARVNVQYYDPDLDYQIGSQPFQIASPYVDNVTTIDLPLVLTAAEARVIAKRECMRMRTEMRDRYRWWTSRKYAHLEPTDVVTILGRDLRIEKKNEEPNGVITWEGPLSAPYIADQPEDPQPGQGHTPNPPSSPRGATTAAFFDVAMGVDTDLDVGFYVAGCSAIAGSSWNGYTLYTSADDGATWVEVASVTAGATMGTVAAPLAPFAGGNVFDNVNVIRVTMQNGAPVSVTELAVLNGANLALVGNEWIGYTTATMVSEGVYDLSGLLRGRRGTEWAMGLHQPNETFALHSTLLNVAISDDDVDQPRLYKAVSFGALLSEAEEIAFTCHAASARCYPPAQLAGGINAAGDLILECYTRTRRGGAWRDFTGIAQADTPEEVVFELWDATFTLCGMVIPGITPASSVATTTIAIADLITVFGDEQQEYYVTAGQVGRFRLGLRAQATVPGNGSTIDDPVNPVPPYNPPVDPGSGGGAVDFTLTPPEDIVNSSGFKVGDTLVVKFTTGAAPIGGSYISVGPYGDPPYALRIRLTTDLAGTALVSGGEAFGDPVASLQLGDLYAWSLNLAAATDYYLHITHRLPNGDLGGPAGADADVGVTLVLET